MVIIDPVVHQPRIVSFDHSFVVRFKFRDVAIYSFVLGGGDGYTGGSFMSGGSSVLQSYSVHGSSGFYSRLGTMFCY